jgi:DMSO/TMAO reductase YedYZ molybdopterin-dependent catalytic subunit
MIRTNKVWGYLAAAAVVGWLLGAAGCNTPDSTATTTGSSSQTALTVIKDTQTVTYTMDSLKKLATISGWAGQMSSTGTITGPNQYKGVAMTEILKAVGGITEGNAVRVSAKDGYSMTLSYNQIMQGAGFPVLDSSTGKEVTSTNKPIVFVAYDMDGKGLDDSLGPLRLGIVTSNTQVTDGHWWVKWTQKIEVVSTVKPWSLRLEGAINEDIDQSTFESCTAIGCHGVKYTDSDNHVWEGVPFWYFLGRVDDATDTHKGDAFSEAIADKGYEVHIVAADGYEGKVTSADAKRNNGMIVASKMDGKPLADKNWPVKLVGSAVPKQLQIGAITKLKLFFSSTTPSTAPASTPTSAPTTTTATQTSQPGATVLTVLSAGKTTTFSVDDLKKLSPVDGFGGQKNMAGKVTGPYPCQGAPLLAVLTAAGGPAGGIAAGQGVKVTASDGYSKTLTYDQIMSASFATYDSTGAAKTPSAKPVIAIVFSANGAALDSATGPVQLGMICTDSVVSDGSWWVKMIQKIEVVAAP